MLLKLASYYCKIWIITKGSNSQIYWWLSARFFLTGTSDFLQSMLLEWHLFCSEPGYLISAVPVFELKLAASKCMFTIQVWVVSAFSSESQIENTLVLLTCCSFADDTTVAVLAGDKFPGPIISCDHDSTLGPGILLRSKGPRLPVWELQSRTILPRYRLVWKESESVKERERGRLSSRSQPATNNVSLSS